MGVSVCMWRSGGLHGCQCVYVEKVKGQPWVLSFHLQPCYLRQDLVIPRYQCRLPTLQTSESLQPISHIPSRSAGTAAARLTVPVSYMSSGGPYSSYHV